jgi:hypothetical protein
MSQCFKVLTGAKRQVFIGDFNPDCTAPLLNTITTGGIQPAISWNLTVNASVVADIAKGATSIAMATVPAGLTKLNIPAGFWVGFKNPGSDVVVPVKLTTAFTEASTTLAVEATGRVIKPGASFEYPVPLGGVTDAVYNPTVNAINSDGSGKGGFNSATPGTNSATLECTVEVDFLDVGLLNLQKLRDGKESLYAVIVYRGGATDYTPYYVEGGVMVASQSFPSPRNGLVSGSTSLPYIDKPIERQPVPVA